MFATPFDHLVMDKLLALYIQGAPLSVLRSLQRPTLRSLTIDSVLGAEMDLCSLLNILKRLPLGILRLRNGIPPLPTSATTVILSRLVFLSLTGTTDAILRFLRSVYIPNITTLLLAVSSSEPCADLEELCPVILSRLNLMRRRKVLRTAVVESGSTGTVRYRAWPQHVNEDKLSKHMKENPPFLDILLTAQLGEVGEVFVEDFSVGRSTTYVFFSTAGLKPSEKWGLHRFPLYHLWRGPEPHLKGTYIGKFSIFDHTRIRPSRGTGAGMSRKRSLSL